MNCIECGHEPTPANIPCRCQCHDDAAFSAAYQATKETNERIRQAQEERDHPDWHRTSAFEKLFGRK